jgi:hypothetical protein
VRRFAHATGLALAVAGVLILCGSCAGGARTHVIKPDGSEESGTIQSGPWLHAAGHLVLTDNAVRDQGFESFDEENLELGSPDEGNQTPGFEVGARFSLDEDLLGVCCFDLGLHVAQMGSGRYHRFETDRRIGSMMEVAGDLRWRMVEQSWGGFYVTTALGWGAVRLSRELEFDLETQGETGPLKPLQHAAVIGLEGGIAWYLSRAVVLRTGLGNRFWQVTLNESSETVLRRTRMSLSVGLEWAL